MKHAETCVFREVVRQFEMSKRDVPMRFGLVELSLDKLKFITMDDAGSWMQFNFCPECGVPLVTKAKKVKA